MTVIIINKSASYFIVSFLEGLTKIADSFKIAKRFISNSVDDSSNF